MGEILLVFFLCRRQARVAASCLHEEMALWRPLIIEAAMLRDGSSAQTFQEGLEERSNHSVQIDK